MDSIKKAGASEYDPDAEDSAKVVRLAGRRRTKRRTDPAEALALAKKMEKRMVREMNRSHAVIRDTTALINIGKDEKGFPTINYATKDGLKLRYANRPLLVPEIKADRMGREFVSQWKKMDRVTAWLSHRLRRDCDTVANYPVRWGDTPPSNIFNVWGGYGAKPTEGDLPRVGGDGYDKDFPAACARMLRHLAEVICASDLNLFRWHLAFLAQMVQDPLNLPRSFIVLTGGQGIGKGQYGKILEALLGPSYLRVGTREQFVGKFNAAFQGRLVVWGDEIFIKDGEAANIVKNRVSESTVTIEAKYKDAASVRNTARNIIASNDEHVWNAANDDRRAAVHAVSEHRVIPDKAPDDHPNRVYFRELTAEIDNKAAVGALFRYLLDYDYTPFSLDRPPSTAALTKQKIQSLHTMESWWYERLCEGVLFGADDDSAHEQSNPWPLEITKTRLYGSFDRFCERMRLGEFKRPTRAAFNAFLSDAKKPVRLERDGRREGSGDRDYIYSLPTLDEARATFAEWLGADSADEVPWGEATRATVTVKPAPGKPATPAYDGCSDEAEDFLADFDGATPSASGKIVLPDGRAILPDGSMDEVPF